MARFDETRLLRVVREGSPQLLYAGCQRIVADRSPTPHGCKQLVLGDGCSRAGHEQLQDVRSLRRQPHFAVAGPEPSTDELESKSFETDALVHQSEVLLWS